MANEQALARVDVDSFCKCFLDLVETFFRCKWLSFSRFYLRNSALEYFNEVLKRNLVHWVQVDESQKHEEQSST